MVPNNRSGTRELRSPAVRPHALEKADLRVIADRRIKVCNSLRPSCIPQLCELAPFRVSKLYYEFESTPLRHTVSSTEKLRQIGLRIARNAQIPRFARSNWTRESGPANLVGDFGAFFSGQRKRSPVSTRALGECNAITNRLCAQGDLTRPARKTSYFLAKRFVKVHLLLFVSARCGVVNDRSRRSLG